MPSDQLTVALAGNPNSGKTTLFNALTGAHQHVANYPGVTVEVKQGHCWCDGKRLDFLDLPGTYSLTAYSPEELVARNAILRDKPDVVVCVVDGSNLERNLYLFTQLAELGRPLVVALNMADEVERHGRHIDVELLSKLLAAPVVSTVATEGKGTQELIAAIIRAAQQQIVPRPFELGPEVDGAVARLEVTLGEPNPVLRRYYAIKLLENDEEVVAELSDQLPAQTWELIEQLRQELSQHFADEVEIIIADQRYGTVSGISREVIELSPAERAERTERIDGWVTHRLLGLPILIVTMWLLFELVFRLGAPPMAWIQTAFGALADVLAANMPEGPLRSLIVDGIIGGVGGVLVFVPQILILFFGIALLEDSGYMARGVFVIDRVMHAIGLHGKSFIPMVLGFGCSVPAVMATRTLNDPKDRITTILVVPLMSCSARLPVYTLLTAAFFAPRWGGQIIMSLYGLGALMALLLAKLFRSTIFKGETAPFVMELPPYRMPTIRALLTHMWERAWLYIQKAGTVILAISIVMWALCNYPKPPPGANVSPLKYSAAGRVGKGLEPVLRPLGFDWKMGVALFAGFAAKEVVVSTFGTIYSLEEAEQPSADLRQSLAHDPAFSPLVAYALMVFVLLYVPCVATVAVIRHETNSWKWPLFMVAYTTTLAWVVAFIVYQGGRLLGLG